MANDTVGVVFYSFVSWPGEFMHLELSKREIAIAARAERHERVWRYGRWVQLLAALLFVGAGFRFGGFGHDAPLFLDVIHPNFLVIFGFLGGLESLHSIRAKERSLLLKLFRSCGQNAI